MTGNAIREALEPFAKALEEASIGTPDTVSLWFHPSAMGLTVGDLRRARTASDAIGSGVKALEWSNGFASTSFGSYDVCEEDDGWHFAVTDYPHRVMDDRSFSYEHEAKAAAQADFERRVLDCLSPVAVEEADAKAGAVDLEEACKPWEFATDEPPEWDSPLHQVFVAGMTYSERLLANLLDVKQYEGGDGSEDFDRDATMSLQNILTEARLWDRDENCSVAARSVDEPGEVKRLTRERDALAEALEQINSTSLSEVFDGRIGEIVSAAREVLAGRFDFNAHSLKVNLARETKRADTAEAALAETRERLVKREEALREIASAPEWWDDDVASCRSDKTKGIARAALTGDAQEGGR